jgi:hypothetical protein
MNPDLPLTRLPVHNPSDCFHSVSVLPATSLIFYATQLGRTSMESPIELLAYYTYNSVTGFQSMSLEAACD